MPLIATRTEKSGLINMYGYHAWVKFDVNSAVEALENEDAELKAGKPAGDLGIKSTERNTTKRMEIQDTATSREESVPSGKDGCVVWARQQNRLLNLACTDLANGSDIKTGGSYAVFGIAAV